ncbi:type II toxin-antitoxin system RelE/ParE family toxin [Aerococcus urinae]|nr:type II toxin-antitoxin system RelE/ParE family toxin [Aerococcus urinae]MDK6370473.1 type II toxin-antitoxin system RelE/ParE family toxin [Aerococcus urinae]MDK6596855.1 type II toxin-antitoxin system RelE/ParE family toxin [Aerococcus urinae]MDK7302318.1 type II toxin-antitoxin system RelE/ParE family toxin [Aerococcus urinae]MDK7800729.1 type II toxin-antitoxin system RelE/ParE family toxin [Aerococcus urinae]MDK8654792.1 type II toxin-antitoxin system RelE/ParE family toxin [Aerococcus
MPKYQIRILPSFEEDLNQIVDYITLTLANPSAAMNLVEKVHKAIEERANYPLSFQAFASQKRENIRIMSFESLTILFSML